MKTSFASAFLAFGIFVSVFAQGQQIELNKHAELSRLILDRNYQAAIPVGLSLAATDSLNPQVYYYLGIAYSQLKQYAPACRAFEKADRLQPGNKPVILNLADCYVEVADVVAAQILIEDLLKKDSSDTLVWLELAQVYQRQSEGHKAAAIYRDLWEKDSSNLWYPRQIGQILVRNEEFRDAIPYLEYVVEADSSDQATFLRLGNAYLQLKLADRIPLMDKAIRQDSMQPLLYRYRGGLWMGTGVYDQAESDLQRALALGDTTIFTCRHLGISQFQLTNYSSARETLKLAVKLDSVDTEAWYYLAYCHKWTEDLPEAIRCMEKAISIGIPPFIGSVYSGLALFHNLQRNLKEAMKFYEKAYEFDPANAYPLSQLGLLVEQTSRDKERAKEYYERFLKEYAGPDLNLVEYVKDRIQIINEKLFMEGKLTR